MVEEVVEEPVVEEVVEEPVVEEAIVTASVSGLYAFDAEIGGESDAQLLTVTGEKLNGESINITVPGNMMMAYNGETATSFNLTPDDMDMVNANLEIFLKNPTEEGIRGIGDLEISGGGQLIKIIINVRVTEPEYYQSTVDPIYGHWPDTLGPKKRVITKLIETGEVVIEGQWSIQGEWPEIIGWAEEGLM